MGHSVPMLSFGARRPSCHGAGVLTPFGSGLGLALLWFCLIAEARSLGSGCLPGTPGYRGAHAFTSADICRGETQKRSDEEIIDHEQSSKMYYELGPAWPFDFCAKM
jgi:hypothetical protein